MIKVHDTAIICVDCYGFHANGDTTGIPGCDTLEGEQDWIRGVEGDLEGLVVSLGVSFDDCGHDGHDVNHDEHQEDCETITFYTFPGGCGSCGSRLAGSGHRVTLFDR